MAYLTNDEREAMRPFVLDLLARFREASETGSTDRPCPLCVPARTAWADAGSPKDQPFHLFCPVFPSLMVGRCVEVLPSTPPGLKLLPDLISAPTESAKAWCLQAVDRIEAEYAEVNH